MKTKTILKSALCAAGLAAFVVGAQAQVVNVDFNEYNGAGGVYTGVGAASDTGTYWNGFNIAPDTATSLTLSNLTASDGVTATGISVNINSPEDVSEADLTGFYNSPFAAALLDAFAYPYNYAQTEAVNFTIGGLTAGHTYDLYFYAQNGNAGSGGGTFTIGSTSLTAANTSDDTTGFIQGNNYVEFTGLTADGLDDISGVVSGVAGVTDYINGLQIVDTTVPAEIPEPSTVALLGLGALGLAFLAARRRHSLV